MKLLAKFNLLLIVVFGLGLVLIAINARRFLLEDAKATVFGQAKLMAASSKATRDYTDQEISPVLENTPEHKNEFLPQTIPFYAATVIFNRVRKSGPDFADYTYKEATLNPTNLTDRATDWEADLINHFRNEQGDRKSPSDEEVVGERDSAVGPTLYLARPIAVEQGCLTCHSSPSVAPKAMLKRYGTQNGFGWHQNEIVAAQIISVPMSVPIQLANTGLRNLLITLGTIFFATIALIDIGMYFIVIRPLRRVSQSADRISTGEIDLPPLPVTGKDEIAEVTTSFNRMHTSLKKAMELLNG
jgi:HAMP domain-containing protein